MTESLKVLGEGAFLWVPFCLHLGSQFILVLFLGTHLDAVTIGVLPGWLWYLVAAGLLVYVLNSLARTLESSPGLDLDVTAERGSGVIGPHGASSPVELRWACASMRGWRPAMEDAHIATVLQHPATLVGSSSTGLGVFAVLDGHGGWQVSACAKYLLRRIFSRRLRSAKVETFDLAATLTDTVVELDETLRGGPLGIGHWLQPDWFHPFSGVGSTACVAVVDVVRGQVVVANAGDSRAILSRGGKAVALTKDHKPEDAPERARIVHAGGHVSKCGPCHRVDGCLNLSRALGDFRFKANTALPASQQKITATPTTSVQDWRGGDDFLLVACDGLFERMTRQGVVDYVRNGLKKGETPDSVLKGLLHACCARFPTEAGTDNESVILVQWSLPKKPLL